jgi:hypothetical protein
LRQIAGERLISEALRDGKPLTRPISDKAHGRPIGDGKLNPISLQDRCLEGGILALPGRDRRQAEPHTLGDDDTWLSARFAETARDGDPGKRRQRMKRPLRHGGAPLPDR